MKPDASFVQRRLDPPCLNGARTRTAVAPPTKTNFENFGRNSRYLRSPGNRLCLRMRGRKGADPRAPRRQKRKSLTFAEVSPGFYYRPQRIMDSVPFCGFACPTLHPANSASSASFLNSPKLYYCMYVYSTVLTCLLSLNYSTVYTNSY